MKIILRHIVRLVSALLLVGMPAACGTESDSIAESPAGDGTVMLVVNTGVIGPSRAGGSAAWPENELMKTLRIVILHADNTVEYNQTVDFGESPQAEYRKQLIKVRQNERKTVYLIANEGSIPGVRDLDAFTKGTAGFRDYVDPLHFALDGSSPLPMSAAYELEVREKAQECQFYLVRAATKFTFRFRNFRDGPVKVNSISVSDIAGTTFLMPHKLQATMAFDEGDGTQSLLFWVDWLKRVSDESQEHPDDKGLADRRGWVMDYDIPATASATATRTEPQGIDIPACTAGTGVPQPGTARFPDFYLPESKHLKAPANGEYGEQEYTMTLRFTDSDGKKQTFTEPFDNLKALFRNTNVVVDVTLGDSKIIVDVIPYTEVVLEPVFGL